MDDPLRPVLALLTAAIGLDPEALGRPLLDRVIRERMRLSGAIGYADYARRAAAEEAELAELIEALVVPETWFFRDMASLELLTAMAASWAGQGVFSVLSAPCSSGEEPYSIAMALLDAGLPPERIRVDAVDISRQALGRAEQALYPPHSFRGGLPEGRNRHFQETPQGRSPVPAVRALVRFRQDNLTRTAAWGEAGAYQAVFCRNFLIYLDTAHKQEALAHAARALRPNGLLFVGAAESMPLIREGFSTVSGPGAYAYRPRSEDQAREPVPTPGVPALRPTTLPQRTWAVPRPQVPIQAPVQATAASPDPLPPPEGLGQDDRLVLARRAADQGRLEEAAGVCEILSRQRPPSPEAFLLLGEIRQAQGETAQARECYRKALYLDPANEQALAHVAVLAEHQGDAPQADRLRQRLNRVRRARPQ